MRVIGINGFRTAGKDSTYRCVVTLRDGAQRAAFADKLKILAGRSLGYTGDDTTLVTLMDEFKEHGTLDVGWVVRHAHNASDGRALTGRQFLQYVGAEARAVFGDTFWIDQVLPRPSGHPSRESRERDNAHLLGERYPGAQYLCITDVRYENEAVRVRALGGEVWEVSRPGLKSDGHSSEQPLPPELIDTRLVNDGTLDQLCRATALALAGSNYVLASRL